MPKVKSKSAPASKHSKTESHKSESTKPETPAKQVVKKSLRMAGKTTAILIGVFVVLVLLIVIGYLGFEYRYSEKVYPGVTIQGQDVSGYSYEEVANYITEYKVALEQTGLQFGYEDKEITIEVSAESPLVVINTDETAQAVFAVGRTGSDIQQFSEKLQALTGQQDIELYYTIDDEALTSILETEYAEFEQPYSNAQLSFATGSAIDIIPHQDGTTFNWDAVLSDVDTHVATLQQVDIALERTPTPAPVTTAIAEERKSDVQTILEQVPLTLIYEDTTYEATQTDVQSWITLLDTGEVGLNQEAVDAYLDIIAGDIDIPVKEGRFSLDIVDGEVQLTQFESGENGLAVNTEKTITVIEEALLGNNQSTVELVVEVTEPRATPDNLDDLGITELLGTGTTNFAGSPVNRRGNIQKGADLLNGLLIAPGEVFSLLDVLNPIDLEHGWLSELVIKGDKLEKEAGGGLCQIGSTVFRATMNAGLEVVERRNHSWAVSYYDYNGKAGVDATIYDPSPDYQFKNDTEHWVLIRSRIEGGDIYFDFWGTSDGRKGYFTEPTNYAINYPGPTEIIVDETKPVGYKDCATHAFVGKSASFDYIIEQPDGTTTTENFTSTYKPQNERCIVGPDAPAESAPSETSQDSTAGNTDNADDTTDSTDETTEDTVDETNDTTDSDTTDKDKNKKKKN